MSADSETVQAPPEQAFLFQALDLDGVHIAREEGELIATRDLADDTVSLGDVIDLAQEHDLPIGDAQMDIPAGEARLIVGGGE